MMALPQEINLDDIPVTLFTTKLIPSDLKHRPKIKPGAVGECFAQSWPQNCEFAVTSPALLMISGTVYASDCLTPLPDTLIEVWYANPDSRYSYTEPVSFRGQLRTDAAGHYEFAALRPGRKLGIYDTGHELLERHLHFHVRYQDNEPLVTRLDVTDDTFIITPASLPAPTKRSTETVDPIEPVLQARFDIVLPVPPSVSSRTNLIPPAVAGEPLTISGVVYTVAGKTPLPDALVEVWQANPTGSYEGYDYPTPAFNLRGQMRTDAAGRYEFTTLKPGPIKVGQDYLPAQIHFIVRYQDYKPLFTWLFFAGDPFLNNISPSPDLTIRLSEQVGPTGPVWQGRFDIFLSVPPPHP
jgi:catechol 1,2-dioxygenase